MSNTFGNKVTLTTFGSSHESCIGGVIDNFPKGMTINMTDLYKELRRRKTGISSFSSRRKESDEIVFLSGINNGTTTGMPIAFVINNKDAKSKDYEDIKHTFRPSHADFTYYHKYYIEDFIGGSRASGRETTSWVVAGALAKQFLKQKNINFYGYISQIGEIVDNEDYDDLKLMNISNNILPVLNADKAQLMFNEIQKATGDGDTLGGVVKVIIKGLPIGLGEPIFDKLPARLASAMLTIPSSKGFDYGAGFDAASMRGSLANDEFFIKNGEIHTQTNNNGGCQGGISNGEDLFFRVAFKPIPSIHTKQKTVDVSGQETSIEIKGRHDVCIVPRVLPVVEALSALVILDFIC